MVLKSLKSLLESKTSQIAATKALSGFLSLFMVTVNDKSVAIILAVIYLVLSFMQGYFTKDDVKKTEQI